MSSTMPKLMPFRTTNPDLLFTLTINLMWQLFYEADDHDVPWLQLDLLVAIGELECGPWRHLGSTPDVLGVRFTILCNLLDWLLAELGRVTGGLGARIALARARSCLDPDHVS